MGRFDDLIIPTSGTPQSQSLKGTMPSKGRFDDVVNTSSDKGGSRFGDILGNAAHNAGGELKDGAQAIGGFIGKLGHIVAAPQEATAGVIEKGLEKTGALKDSGIKGTGIKYGIQEDKSNVSTINRLGVEHARPGSTAAVLTGTFDGNSGFWGNFVKVLPSTLVGTTADFILDPLNLLGEGLAKGVGKAVGVVGKGAKYVAEDIPALQKVGDMLGKAFITRYGQREAFTEADRARKIAEELAMSDTKKLVAPTIEKPAFIQQRVKQILEGSITSDNDLKILAEPIREEFDRVGAAISNLNPKLLSEETFQANKGTYFPRLYTSKEFPDETAEEIIGNFFGGSPTSIPKDRFTARLDDWEFAKKVDPTIVDTEAAISRINNKVDDMVARRSSDVEGLNKEIDKLEKAGLKISLRKDQSESFNELSSILKQTIIPTKPQTIADIPGVGKALALDLEKIGIKSAEDLVNTSKTGLFAEGDAYDPVGNLRKLLPGEQADNVVRAAQEIIDTNKGLKPKVNYDLQQPTLEGRDIRRNIEKLILAPEKDLVKLKNAVSRKDSKIARIFDDIDAIRKENRERIDALPSMGRIKQLAEQARTSMGEIKEAGYGSLKGLTQLKITEVRQEFFKKIAQLASDTPEPGMIQLGDNKALGDLAGKFLPPAEYKAVAEVTKIPSPLDQLYSKALGLWKTGKTAYNPGTISRNDIFNFFVLNPLGGVPITRLDIYAKAVNELKTQGHLYQLARKEGLEISTQQAAELEKAAVRFYKEDPTLVKQFFGKVQSLHEAVKNFYGNQDKFFKMANFIKGVTEDGMTPYEAMRRANFYLVDYSEVPEAMKILRKSPLGIPFISFTYGVSKPLAKTLIEDPVKLANYYKVLRNFQQMNPMGETPADRANEKNVLPDWVSHGSFLRLPVKDHSNRSQYVDIGFMIPFSDLTRTLKPSNPLFTIASGLYSNKHPFFQKEIWSDTDSSSERISKQANYVLSSLLPSFTPFVGSSFDKTKNAIQKRPDKYSGYVRSKLQTFIDVFGGVKVTPIDPTIEAQARARERQNQIQDLMGELRKIQSDKSLFPEEKARDSEKIHEKITETINSGQ